MHRIEKTLCSSLSTPTCTPTLIFLTLLPLISKCVPFLMEIILLGEALVGGIAISIVGRSVGICSRRNVLVFMFEGVSASTGGETFPVLKGVLVFA